MLLHELVVIREFLELSFGQLNPEGLLVPPQRIDQNITHPVILADGTNEFVNGRFAIRLVGKPLPNPNKPHTFQTQSLIFAVA
jgi:hypothetical protein